MLAMQIKSRRNFDDMVKDVKNFFGSDGEGLELEEEQDGCLLFRSELGYVNVRVTTEQNLTIVELTTQEYEYQVRSFAERQSHRFRI